MVKDSPFKVISTDFRPVLNNTSPKLSDDLPPSAKRVELKQTLILSAIQKDLDIKLLTLGIFSSIHIVISALKHLFNRT